MLNVKSETYLKEISNRYRYNNQVYNLYARDYLFLNSFIVKLIDYRRYLYKNLLGKSYSELFWAKIKYVNIPNYNITEEIKISDYPISSLIYIQYNILSCYDK